MKRIKLLNILCLLFTIYLPAQTIYYVDSNNGNNNNTGLSPTAAFQQIQYASGVVSPGDTVKIMPGTYTGENPSSPWAEIFIQRSGSNGNYITFQGVKDAQGNLPKVVSASIKGIDVFNTSYIIIENLEFEPAPNDVKNLIGNPNFGLEQWRQRRGIAMDNNSHHVIIRNNYFHDFPGNGITIGGSDIILIEGNLVEHCAYEANNANSGISAYQPSNLNVGKFPEYPNHSIIFKNNISRYNVNLRGFAGGIGNNRMTDGNGIIVDDFTQNQSSNPVPYTGRTLVIGNICYGNGGQGINIFSSNNVDVYHNTMFDNGQTTRIANPAYEVAIGDSQLSIGRVNNANIKNNILYNTNGSRTTISRYQDTNINYNQNIHWNTTGNPEPVSSNDIVTNPNLTSTNGLTQSQTNLLATMTNPYNQNSTSARLRLPTVNNGFPVQNVKLLAGSPAIGTAENVGFGTSSDIGALPFDVSNPGSNDDIVSVSAPEEVNPGTMVGVTVTYSSSTNRDIQVAFQSVSGPNYTVYGETIVPITEGSGTITVRVPIASNTPIAVDEYQFQTFITTPGGGWPNRTDNVVRTGVDCTNASTGTFSTITIGAEGFCGGEKIQLLLNNQTVSEWTLTSDIELYTYNQYRGDQEIKIAFVNDANNGCDLNVNIDWIQVCGTLYQTEDNAIRTGCGYGQELYCNGNFNFGVISCSPNNRSSFTKQVKPRNTTVNIFPNPIAKSNPTITISGADQQSKYQIKLYNLTGAVVFTKDHVLINSTIGLNNIGEGLYILDLMDETTQETIKTSKLIIK
ncbi:carbohydrate-binding domain-containing protein [uncultured Aquimarina sp.]|uniref:carbohydrate-binding domain-containing protein n=1 Tax=uncultured Aquimarina sp. TaxID=575652 RepID=UPI00262B41C4|nr:carbohydrate-binding domain-containing protein [uncultured Aquimarina sp.]